MSSCLSVRNWYISFSISSSNSNQHSSSNSSQHRRFSKERKNHRQIQINIVVFQKSEKIIVKFKSTFIVKFKSTSSSFKKTKKSSSNSNQHSSSNSNQHRRLSEKRKNHRQIQINIHRQIQINIHRQIQINIHCQIQINIHRQIQINIHRQIQINIVVLQQLSWRRQNHRQIQNNIVAFQKLSWKRQNHRQIQINIAVFQKVDKKRETTNKTVKTLHFCFEFFVQSAFQLYLYNRCFRKLQNIFFNVWCNHRTASFWCFFRRDLFCFTAKHFFQYLMKLSNNFVLMFSSTWSISFYFRFLVLLSTFRSISFQLYLYSHCLENCRTFFSMSNHRTTSFWCFLEMIYFVLLSTSRLIFDFSFNQLSTVFVQSLFRRLQNIFFNV